MIHLIKHIVKSIPTWTMTVLVTVIILYLTLFPHPIPNELNIQLFKGIDKVVHFIMFYTLALIFCIDLAKQIRCCKIAFKYIFIIIIGIALFGGLIEILQELMGLGRTSSWYDFLADSVGTICGTFTFILSAKNITKN